MRSAPMQTPPQRAAHRHVVWQPLWDAQVSNLYGDLLAMAWFGHTDGSKVLKETRFPLEHSSFTKQRYTHSTKSKFHPPN